MLEVDSEVVVRLLEGAREEGKMEHDRSAGCESFTSTRLYGDHSTYARESESMY